MDDERFKSLKNERVIKNKRGRNYTDLPKQMNYDSEESEAESIASAESISENDSNAFSDDSNDLDFINLTKDAKTREDSTKRLAVCHFDYEEYTLANLADLIKSGMPQSGKIKSITKYPTEMYMERFEGDVNSAPKEFRIQEYSDLNQDSDSESNNANKEYAISRLKFFFTVFEFDSTDTADAVYKLDGVNLGDSGLKLDLRYVPDDKTYEIPDKFMHLVQVHRGNSKKSKYPEFKPSCFAQTKCRKPWDGTPADKVAFYHKACDESDYDCSDVEDYFDGASQSEFSATESESEFITTIDGPSIPKLRRKRVPVRQLMGLGEKDDKSSEDEYEEENSDNEEEVEDIAEEAESGDDYVVDESGEYEGDNSDSSVDEESKDKDDNKAEKKKKKINVHEKAKLMIKENALKREKKLSEIKEYLKEAAQTDDRRDYLFTDIKYFQMSQDNKRYENAKSFVSVFMGERSKITKIKFVHNSIEEDGTVMEEGPASKRKKLR